MSISKPAASKHPAKRATPGRHQAAKVFDVARPGKTAASSTSKPVIITNRPVIQDPMVISVNAESAAPAEPGQPPTAPPLKVVQKLVIQPIHEHVAPEPAAAPPPATEPLVDDDTSNKSAVAALDGVPAAAVTAADNAIAGPSENDVQLTPQATEENVETDQAKASKLRQIIDSEQYFLPINSVENKRNQRIAVAGLGLIILLGVAWYNTALDAGLLSNMLHLPHSHFFSK